MIGLAEFFLEIALEVVVQGVLTDAFCSEAPAKDSLTTEKSRIAEYGIIAGDVVALCRGNYRHFGLCVGATQVICAEAKGNGSHIVKVDLRRFLRGAVEYEVLVLADRHRATLPNTSAEKRLYPPEEAIKRAESRLGSPGGAHGNYFGLWCRTGICEPQEVTLLLGALRAAGGVQARKAK